jgi:hypothetical protein
LSWLSVGSNWTDFNKICWLKNFPKTVENFMLDEIKTSTAGILHKEKCTFSTISRWILLRIRNDSEWIFRPNENTFYFKCSFLNSCLLWYNVEKCAIARHGTDDIIRLMSFVCWLDKARDTHSEIVEHCFSTSTIFTQTHYITVICTFLFLFCFCLGKYAVDTQ